MKIQHKVGLGILVLSIMTTFPVPAQEHPITETEKKIEAVSAQEKQVMEKLYTMDQELDGISRELERISREIRDVRQELDVLDSDIEDSVQAYERGKNALKNVLLTYQKMGPGSFFEIVLNAESLSDFLRRINTLRDLSSNTQSLLADIEADRLKIEAQKAERESVLSQLEGTYDRQSAVMAQQKDKIDEMSAFLLSLREERGTYEAYLAEIKAAWNMLLPAFKEASLAFNQVIASGNLPPEAIEITFTTTGLLGILNEKTFNDMIHQQDELSGMAFEFTSEGIGLTIGAQQLILQGHFRIEAGHRLIYEPVSGSFYDLPLSRSSLDALFEQGQLIMELEPILGGTRIAEIKEQENKVGLTIELGADETTGEVQHD